MRIQPHEGVSLPTTCEREQIPISASRGISAASPSAPLGSNDDADSETSPICPGRWPLGTQQRKFATVLTRAGKAAAAINVPS